MGSHAKNHSFSSILQKIKEYWFLITITMSLLVSIFYMAVFQVTPLDKYYEIKHRRDQVRFHGLMGYSLLEQGHYKLAKTEFEESINLSATDYKALNGRYLANLFIDMESPAWDPAVGLTIQRNLKNWDKIDQESFQHILEKFMGDLNYRINSSDNAKRHYEKALELKSDYIDTLFTYGWFCYDRSDIKKMELLFSKMTKADPFDYRGFHGLGYALYMQSIKESSPQHRMDLINQARKQSRQASDLIINHINIVMDFGEIALSSAPRLSIYFHNRALQLLDDPDRSQLPQNKAVFGNNLLTRDGYIAFETSSAKRAWIKYQLALDHLALHRKEKREGNLKLHDDLLNAARKLDKNNDIFLIYEDQLNVLNLLLPDS